MRHFSYLNDEQLNWIFYKVPEAIRMDSDKELIERALGATLYMPALRSDIRDMLAGIKIKGLASMVICLEDAIDDGMIEEAEKTLVEQLRMIGQDVKTGIIDESDLPFIFINSLLL